MRIHFRIISIAAVITVLCCTCSSAYSQRSAEEWSAITRIIGGIQGVSTMPPKDLVTTKYTSGALIGNGDIGVVVGDTTTEDQRFWFGKSDFWGTHWNTKHNAPEVSILSLGSLILGSGERSTVGSSIYKVDQNLLDADVTTTMELAGQIVHLRSWTCDESNIFVTQISADPSSTKPVLISLKLEMPDRSATEHAVYPQNAGIDHGIIWASRENNLHGGGDYQAKAGIAVRVLSREFAAGPVDLTSVNGLVKLRPHSSLWIVTVFKSDARIGSSGPSVKSLVESAVSDASQLSILKLRKMEAAHREWWKRFWLRSYVDLHDPVLESYYYGALYVMGCSSRPGKLAPSLWGNFITTDDSAWGGRYFMNYNEEAPYYGVFSSNHADLAEPYNQMVLAQFPFQKNRTAEAGYKGVSFQRTFSPFTTIAAPPAPVPIASVKDYHKLPSDQKSNATFSLLPSIQYYEYTQDFDFLRTRLYPAMKELDAFWRDFAILNPQSNRWVFEHTSAHEGGDDVNPNLDIGFAQRIERELIEASEKLGVDAAMQPTWREFASRLSPYPTGEVDGKAVYLIAASIKNNITDQGLFEPGNQPINLEGLVFPGENLAIGGDRLKLEIARNSLAKMDSWGVTRGGNSHNGFCKIFPIAARIGWPAEDLVDKFKAAILYQWRPSNLTVFQGGGGIETSGSVEALDSMLLQHENGVLRVFPDWPATRDASFFHLRAKGAFLVSSRLSGGKVTEIDIDSEAGGALTILSPWGTHPVHLQGRSTPWMPDQRGTIKLDTIRGGHYRLSE